jgi:hypothetical protein
MNRLLAASLLSLLCGAELAAQDRPVAIRNARVLTMAGPPLERATVVLRAGVIDAIGADVQVPAGAEVIDAAGGTLMPGMVSAFSRAGFRPEPTAPRDDRSRQRRRRGSGGSEQPRNEAKNEAAEKVADAVYPREDVFGELLRCGITTLALTPDGAGFPGLGAVVDPSGRTRKTLIVDDAAFVVVSPTTGTKNKKLMKDALAKAQALVGARKAPPAPPPSAPPASQPDAPPPSQPTSQPASQPASLPASQPTSQPAAPPPAQPAPKSQENSAPKSDPNHDVLADVLEGKRRAFLEIGSANALAHFLDVLGTSSIPQRVLVATRAAGSEGRLDEVIDALAPLRAPILMEPALVNATYTRSLVNPPALLHGAGLEVGFLLPDERNAARGVLFRLMELVRHGLDRDAALAGVTRVPAKALGLDDRVGSLVAGKVADLLLFDRDPLDPAARLVAIWHRGRAVQEQAQ